MSEQESQRAQQGETVAEQVKGAMSQYTQILGSQISMLLSMHRKTNATLLENGILPHAAGIAAAINHFEVVTGMAFQRGMSKEAALKSLREQVESMFADFDKMWEDFEKSAQMALKAQEEQASASANDVEQEATNV